jgi:Ni/Fe-hydrogenase subunit HybB-like protein
MTDIIVTYDVQHSVAFGFLIVLFISVTGLNAGSYLASVIFTYLNKKEYLPLAKFSALMVLFLWVVAPILLLMDIGQPLLFWHIFAYFDPGSPMAWGTVILTVYPVLASVYIYYLFRGEQEKAKRWGLIGLPVALGSHAFVGFVLIFAQAHVFWGSSLIPIFFLLTATLSGLAMVMIFDTIRYYLILERTPGAQAQERLIFHHVGEALYILIFADLGLILFYLMKLGISPDLFNKALSLVTTGNVSSLDLLLPIILGLLVPLGLLTIPKTARSPFAEALACSFILGGNFLMTSLIITAGQVLPLI